MRRQLAFRKAHELGELHDELLAAGISPASVSGDGRDLELGFELDVPDDATEEAIEQALAVFRDQAAPIVEAHNRAAGRRRRAMRELRQERNRRIAATDWTQLGDAPAGDKQAWADYRQALRDLPATTADPESPTWPTPPAEVEQQASS